MFHTNRALSPIYEDNIMEVKLKKMKAFDSFSAVYKILFWTGYYKPLEKSKSRFWRICHQIYRCFAFTVAFIFNLMHLIFAWEHHGDMDELLENVMVEIPQMNLFIKLLAFNLQSKRIDKLNELLHNPIFAANCENDEVLLTNDKIEMHRLSKVMNLGVTLTGLLFWPISFFAKRLNDENAVIPAYVPFDTKSWTGFSWSVAMEVIPVLWIGYGHIALDCVAVTYYSQIRVQLKIIKYNIERLFDTKIISENIVDYTDTVDKNVHHGFVYYVRRYDRLIWFSREVNRLFDFSMTFQFVTSSTVLCVIIYKMSSTKASSAPFMFQLSLIIILLMQVFLYCYYGNLVSHESQSVNRSVYLSDWSAVSPSFRRQLLVAMTRWSLPIVPKVCGVIPLSLHTFITIVKSSYTLYTVLATRQK